jgi:hypothetical protein
LESDENYEICLFVVDKAVLDLKPHPSIQFNETTQYDYGFVNVCRK